MVSRTSNVNGCIKVEEINLAKKTNKTTTNEDKMAQIYMTFKTVGTQRRN